MFIILIQQPDSALYVLFMWCTYILLSFFSTLFLFCLLSNHFVHSE